MIGLTLTLPFTVKRKIWKGGSAFNWNSITQTRNVLCGGKSQILCATYVQKGFIFNTLYIYGGPAVTWT